MRSAPGPHTPAAAPAAAAAETAAAAAETAATAPPSRPSPLAAGCRPRRRRWLRGLRRLAVASKPEAGEGNPVPPTLLVRARAQQARAQQARAQRTTSNAK